MKSKIASEASRCVLNRFCQEQLAFERGIEAFAHRVIVAVADRPHRHHYTGVSTAFAQSYRRILRSVIGMPHDGLWLATIDRHVERIDDEFFAHMACHRPAHNAPAADIHYRKEQETGLRRNVRVIGDPKLVGKRRGKVAFDEIARNFRGLVTDRRGDSLAARSPVASKLAHQTCDFVACVNAVVAKLSLNSWPSIRRSRVTMNRLNSIGKRAICKLPCWWFPLQPSVIAIL